MRSFEEIVEIVLDMQRDQGPMLSRMKGVLDRYEGDWVLPVPEVPNEPELPPLTPALIGEAVDNMAMRAASTRPMVTVPAVDPMKDTGARSRERANTRRKIIAATYAHSKWQLGLRRFYRHMSAYHTGSLVVLPDFKHELPRIEVRDPLGTYAEPQANEELRPPRYVAFINRFSADYLRKCFPMVRSESGGPVTGKDHRALWDVVEWIDEEQIVWGLLGPVEQYNVSVSPQWQQAPWMQISPSYPNRCEHMPAVVPHNVSLGKIAGRLASMIGNVDLQAKLMTLFIIAQEKAIFPDVYIVGRQNMQPQIVGGRWEDGREGKANLLMDVETVGTLRTSPDPGTMQLTDRLERNFRTSTGLVPQFGGETYGALRTGRGVDALAGIAVDPRIQEMHEIYEAWGTHLNQAILACFKGYWPDKKYSMYTRWPGDNSHVEFVPQRDIESYENTVSYVVAGADVVQQTQILGSLYGAKAISARTFRQMHPWINDPETEGRIIDEEAFEDALKQTIIQQMATGQMPPMIAVMVRNGLQEHGDIFRAVEDADRKARELQAQQAPPPPEGMAMPPESMPGMAGGPGMLQQPMPPEAMPVPPEEQVQVPEGAAAMRQLMQVMGGA